MPVTGISESNLSYKYYNRKHPLGIFNSTSTSVLMDFIDLLIELEDHQTNYDKNKEIKLGDKFQVLIKDFIRFHESCYEVIQGCCKIHTPPQKKQPIYTWLHQNGYKGGDDLFSKISGDLKYFLDINNKLKHTSQDIRVVNFHNDKSAIMGFYVQAAFSDMSVGPDEEIHPRHHGTHSSDSFNFTLRRLYYLLYKLSTVLCSVIRSHYRDNYKVNLLLDPNCKNDDKLWRKLYEQMSKLPESYFPNEFGKKIYVIQESNSEIIFVKKPARYTDLDNWMFVLIEKGDGATLSYRIPFIFPKVSND